MQLIFVSVLFYSIGVYNKQIQHKSTMDYPTEEEEFEMMYQQELEIMQEINDINPG